MAGKWVACGGGDCSCATIWDREHDVPILKAYRGEWGDEYPVIKVEIGDRDRPDNARISAVMEKMAYGYIDPKFSAKIVKQVTALPDLIEAAKPFERWLSDLDPEFSDHEDDIIVAGRGENVVTFGHLRALRSVLTRIQGGDGNG